MHGNHLQELLTLAGGKACVLWLKYCLNYCAVVRRKTFCRFIVPQPYLITLMTTSPVIRITHNQKEGCLLLEHSLFKTVTEQERLSSFFPFLFSLADLICLFLLIIYVAGLCILPTSLALINIDSRNCANTFSLAFGNPAGNPVNDTCNTLIAYMGQIAF